MSDRPSASCAWTETPFFATSQGNDLKNYLVDLQVIFSWGRLLDEGTDSADDLAGSIAVCKDTIERLPGLLQIWRFFVQPAQRGRGIVDRCCDRLIDFMGNRGRQLSHRRDPVRMCQLDPDLSISLLAFPCRLFGFLADRLNRPRKPHRHL